MESRPKIMVMIVMTMVMGYEYKGELSGDQQKREGKR
jgi:hypothetical protein